jgi:hypothetical protein
MLDRSGGEIDAELFQYIAISDTPPSFNEIPVTIWAVGPIEFTSECGWILSVMTCDCEVSILYLILEDFLSHRL